MIWSTEEDSHAHVLTLFGIMTSVISQRIFSDNKPPVVKMKAISLIWHYWIRIRNQKINFLEIEIEKWKSKSKNGNRDPRNFLAFFDCGMIVFLMFCKYFHQLVISNVTTIIYFSLWKCEFGIMQNTLSNYPFSF